MGNIVPRARINPTSLAFWASVLPLYHVSSLISPVYPRPPAYTAPCLRSKCKLLHSSPRNCKSFNAYNYIHTYTHIHTHIHTYRQWAYTYTGQVQQSYSAQFVQDPGHSTSVMGVMKMGNIVPRARIKPTSLTFWVSVLPVHHVASLMSPLYPRAPIYAAPCLRGQCRLLQVIYMVPAAVS